MHCVLVVGERKSLVEVRKEDARWRCKSDYLGKIQGEFLAKFFSANLKDAKCQELVN